MHSFPTIEDEEDKGKNVRAGSEGMPQGKWDSHIRIGIFACANDQRNQRDYRMLREKF